MREHKYRGKRLDNKEWVKGWYVEADGKSFIVKPGDNCVYDKPIRICGLVEVIPETVSESTGLKDENGKDLNWYEGDVFRIAGVLYKIVFDEECFFFDGIDAPYRYSAASIAKRSNGNVPSPIGNIHNYSKLSNKED